MLTNLAFGIRPWSLETKEFGMAGRGRVVEDQGSWGPGTKMKLEAVRREGNEARRLESWRKLSAWAKKGEVQR